jgi:hypothetical protein
MRECDLRRMRGKQLPMSMRQALANAVLALEHVALCNDDEDHTFEEARRVLAAVQRSMRKREQKRNR